MRFAKVTVVTSHGQITMIAKRGSVASIIRKRSLRELGNELCGRNSKWIFESEQKVVLVTVGHAISSICAKTDRSIRAKDISSLILNHDETFAIIVYDAVEVFGSQSITDSRILKFPLSLHV